MSAEVRIEVEACVSQCPRPRKLSTRSPARVPGAAPSRHHRPFGSVSVASDPLTTIPFWLLMTATRVLGYTVRVAAVPDVQIAEPLSAPSSTRSCSSF